MSPSTYTTVDEWIRDQAISFSPDVPDRFDAAVEQMLGLLGSQVELLGLGEALHGGEEILLLRNRLFQHLVEAHGYSAIAVESSFPRGQLVNDYVNGRGGLSYDAVQGPGFSHGFGALEANRELIEWMRRINADSSRPVKVQFYGFDSPTEMMYSDSPRRLLTYALDFLASVDRAAGSVFRERIVPLLGDDAAWENPMANIEPSQSIGLSPEATSLRLATEDLVAALLTRRPEIVAKRDLAGYQEAMHYAAAARQLLNYHAGVASKESVATLLGMRDGMMADNLAYIVGCERNRGKVFAFAHNSHLQRGKAQWQWGPDLHIWWPAGAHLHALFGTHYAVIGSGLGTSDENGIGQPEAGTLERFALATPGPARFLPIDRAQTLPASALASLPVRSGSTKNFGYFPLTARSLTDFDALVILDASVYSRGGPPLQQS